MMLLTAECRMGDLSLHWCYINWICVSERRRASVGCVSSTRMSSLSQVRLSWVPTHRSISSANFRWIVFHRLNLYQGLNRVHPRLAICLCSILLKRRMAILLKKLWSLFIRCSFVVCCSSIVHSLQCVVVTESPLPLLLRINDFCRSRDPPIKVTDEYLNHLLHEYLNHLLHEHLNNLLLHEYFNYLLLHEYLNWLLYEYLNYLLHAYLNHLLLHEYFNYLLLHEYLNQLLYEYLNYLLHAYLNHLLHEYLNHFLHESSSLVFIDFYSYASWTCKLDHGGHSMSNQPGCSPHPLGFFWILLCINYMQN